MALTSRGRALRWLTAHRYLTEQPNGSNWDNRPDGIAAAIKRCGFKGPIPWCGAWHFNALKAGGVRGISSRQASVALIEEDAKDLKAPYSHGWVTPAARNWHQRVNRGDAVVLFGYGVHVETVRSVSWTWRKLGLIRTEGGNTSSGNAGSQDEGGGSYPRYRKISDVRGFGLVDYPNN